MTRRTPTTRCSRSCRSSGAARSWRGGAATRSNGTSSCREKTRRSSSISDLAAPKERLHRLGDRLAFERRARPTGEASPHARLAADAERRPVLAHDLVRNDERLPAEAADARAHLAAIALLGRRDEAALGG